MKLIRILFNFLRMPDRKLEAFAANVFKMMTGNPDFPNPMPSLDDLNTANQRYADSLFASQHGDRLKVAVKDEEKVKLKLVVSALAHYVMGVANGNAAIMMGAGYTINSQTNNKIEIGAVESYLVTPGKNSGEAVAKVKVKGATLYTHKVALAGTDNPVWDLFPVLTSSFTFTGLQPLKSYMFCCRATDSEGGYVDTETITKAVL